MPDLFKTWPAKGDQLTPDEVIALYANGFAGAVYDPKEYEAWQQEVIDGGGVLKARAWQELADLVDLADREVSSLSGGERQRLAVARALLTARMRHVDVLVADEPTAHLDADGEQTLLNAIHALEARGAAVVIVKHEHSITVDTETQRRREEMGRRLAERRAGAQEAVLVQPLSQNEEIKLDDQVEARRK